MKALLFSLLLTTQSWAQVSNVTIKNFNFDYHAPMGLGTADEFSYQKAITASQKVSVEKIGTDFKIHLEGVESQELLFQNAPALIRDAYVMNLKGLNLSFSDGIAISMASGLFQSAEKGLSLDTVNLACERASAQKELMDQVLVGCLNKLSLKAGGFTSQGEGMDQALMKALDEQHDEFLASVGIKTLDLKIAGGKYDLSAEVRAQVSGKVRSTGVMSYESSQKKMTIKINEVRFGFLDVTSKVFDELKKQESSHLQVNRPYIYLTVK